MGKGGMKNAGSDRRGKNGNEGASGSAGRAAMSEQGAAEMKNTGFKGDTEEYGTQKEQRPGKKAKSRKNGSMKEEIASSEKEQNRKFAEETNRSKKEQNRKFAEETDRSKKERSDFREKKGKQREMEQRNFKALQGSRRELMEKPLIMEGSKSVEDTDVNFQKREPITVQGSNVLKGSDQTAAKTKQEPESIEDGIGHKVEEMPSKIQRKRAPKNIFKSDGLMRESKSLLRKNAMHEEASDEDKAWLASLSDVEVDLLVSIKQMAMERANTVQDECVNGIFGFRVLRTIGLLLKELIKERLKSVHFPGMPDGVPNILLEKHASHVSLGGVSTHILEKDTVEATIEEKTVGEEKKRKRGDLGKQMERKLKKQKMVGDGASVEISNS